MEYYYEIKNGKIQKSNYPVQIFQGTKVVKDSPLVTKDIYKVDEFKYELYGYKKEKDSIAIVFFNYGAKKWSWYVDYILNPNDSVLFMLNKSMPINGQSKSGISVSGRSKYLGKRIVIVSNMLKEAYCFEENDKTPGSDIHFYNITETYLDSATLIPVQLIQRRYDMKDVYTGYFSITKVRSVTGAIPKYSNQKDLVLYEDKSLNWTPKQKEAFVKQYAHGPKDTKYLQCIVNALDSFYNVERSPVFKSVMVRNNCKEFAPGE